MSKKLMMVIILILSAIIVTSFVYYLDVTLSYNEVIQPQAEEAGKPVVKTCERVIKQSRILHRVMSETQRCTFF